MKKVAKMEERLREEKFKAMKLPELNAYLQTTVSSYRKQLP